MKKLMIGAAVAALASGAFAGACDDVNIGGSEGCLVYDLKFTVKTLAPKKLTCKGCSKCDDSTILYYLDAATRTFNGYVWFCADDCWTIEDQPYLVLWEKKSKTVFAPLFYTLNETGTSRGIASDVQPKAEFAFLGRYGKKANKIAAAWSLDDASVLENEDASFTFMAAGINGAGFKMKDACYEKGEAAYFLKSISGNVAGALAIDTVVLGHSKCDEDPEYEVFYVNLCDCFSNYCLDDCTPIQTEAVPASGTWSLKYNAGLSKGSKSMLTIVPAWAQVAE